MDNLKDLFLPVVFFSGMLGGIVAFILCFVNQTNSYSTRLLAGFLIAFSLFAVNHFFRNLGLLSFRSTRTL